jgi:hypothetical protein
MQTVTTIGLDIAKSLFQVHGVDANGVVVIRRQLKRRYVLAFFQKLPSCLIGIEACASSHFWARELRALGHIPRLMPPAYVKRTTICEAVTRATMRFVEIKTPEQQGCLMLHRTRHLFIRQPNSARWARIELMTAVCCQALIMRSNSRICALSIRSCIPSATIHARATSGTRLSRASATIASSSSMPLRPTGATMAPAPGSMELGVPDHRQRASREQTAQIPVALFSGPAEPLLPAAGVLLRYKPTQAEKFLPDRKAFGSAILATSAVASAGPTPGISSSRLLISLDRSLAYRVVGATTDESRGNRPSQQDRTNGLGHDG